MSDAEVAEQRALILAPHGRDSALARAILAEAGLTTAICPDLAALCHELARGAGLAVVAEEALATADLHGLSAWLGAQPPWSDFPFVLLTRRAGDLERNPAALRLMTLLGNVSFLERPFHPLTLVSAAVTALRMRRRQYQAREHLREREAAAAALAAAHARTAEILESIDLGFYAVDHDWRLTYVNRHTERFWGKPRGEVLGRVLWDLFPGPEVQASEDYRLHLAAARERRPMHGAYPSGALGVWVEVHIQPSPGGLSVYFRDITVRRRAEAALRESEARYRMLVETAPDAIHVHQDGRLVFANTRAARLFGAGSPDALLGRPIFDLVAPESLALARSRTAALSEPGTRAGLAELTFRRLDGSPFPVEADAAAVLIGGRLAIQVVFRDITARRRAEAALRESEARLRLAVEATGLGTWDVDLQAGARRWSKEFRSLLGLPPEAEPDPGLFASLIHPEDRDWVKARYHAAYQPAGGGRYEAEFRIRRGNDGAERWMLATGSIFFDAAGRPLRGIGTLMDVTERKRAEERQALLVAELNHRVKNMLALMQAIARQTAARAATPAGFVEAFQGRLGALAAAHDLLTASGWHGAGLRALLERTLAAYRYGGDGARLEIVAEDLPLRPAVAQDLSLAVHELATNAAKHGALSVAGGRVQLKAEATGQRMARELRLVWHEEGGPPVERPAVLGFGTMLLTRVLAHQHAGRVELDWRREGLVCVMHLPLKAG